MTLTQITEKGIKDGEIKNVDINTSAGIAGSKISPAFTSNITGTGDLTLSSGGSDRLKMTHAGGGAFAIKNPSAAALRFGTNNADDELVIANGGNVGINATAPSDKLEIRAGGIYLHSESQASSGALSNKLRFLKYHTASTGAEYEVARIEPFTNNGYNGGLDFYYGKLVGGGAYAITKGLRLDHYGSLAIGTSTVATDLNTSANQLVIGDGSVNVGMTIHSPATGAANIYFANGTSGTDPFNGYIQMDHNGEKLIFGPGAGATNSEAYLLNSSLGVRLGVGVNPTQPIDVKSGEESPYIKLHNTNVASAYTGFSLSTPTQNSQTWINGPNNTGYGGANAITFWQTANAGFHFYNSNTHHATINANGLELPSGNGVYFSAYDVGGVNNLLDDYEEGTYTPTINTGMNSGFTYTVQTGHYTKIGRLVRFDFFIQIAAGTSNGVMYRVTIPFTCDTTGTHRGSGAITYIDVASTSVSHTPNLYIGAVYCELYAGPNQYTSTSGTSQAGKYLIGGGTFHTAT